MSRFWKRLLLTSCAFLSLAASLEAQAGGPQVSSPSIATVPTLVKFSGVISSAAIGASGRGVGITFAFYKDQQGGAPLWLETQSVRLDATGHYSVQLGSTLPNGLPKELFASGDARWLGVRAEGQAEQPRVLLLSVPYALKAADAETLGGLPASAFALAAPTSAASPGSAGAPGTNSVPPPNAAVTGLGTVNTVPLWDTTNDIVNSAISQIGSGTTAKIGINTTAPTVTLDVKGASTIRGPLTMPTTGTATAGTGKNSQPFNLSGSAFNSGTAAAANQTFRFQTEPVGNNTATPSGKLSLLYYAGANAPTETGLSIASNGQITFAPEQTFPGGSGGDITGVTAGTGLTGGGTSGTVTLNLDTTKVPQLSTANLFTGNQSVIGNVTSNGLVSGSVLNALTGFNLGGNPFATGSMNTANSFLGFAGNQTGTGADNVGTGQISLLNFTTGNENTANGVAALKFDTTGSDNTAVGLFALSVNTTGSKNTALGANAGPDAAHPALINSTAIGANAQVTASNALVLGSINGVNGATADTLIGIGTTAPMAKLDVRGNANFTGPITFAAGQTFPGAGTVTSVTAGTGLTGGGTSGNVSLNLDTTKVPQLSTANTFTGNQTVNASLTATGVVSAASYQIGSNLFASGNATSNNVYLGFAGNQTTSGYGNTGVGGQALVANAGGINNTASGQAALPSNTSGTDNVAVGVDALQHNTLGNNNTGIGVIALANNTTGANNTGLGYGAGPDPAHPNLTNATAIGANAVVSESNALVLGPAGVNVGIGTSTPAYPLHVNGIMRSEVGLSLGGNASAVVDAPGIVGGRFTILANGNVGINKANPVTNLDVAGNIAASGALIGGSLNLGGSGIINGGLTTGAGIVTGAGVSVGGPLSTSGGLTIKGDTTMNAAPHMYFGGFFAGSIVQGQYGSKIRPTKDILITYMSIIGGQQQIADCNPTGTISIVVQNGGPLYGLVINTGLNAETSSGPLSIPVSAGTGLYLQVTTQPGCGIFQGPNNVQANVEYVMQ